MLFSLNKYVVSVAFFMCGMTAAYSVDMSVVNVDGKPVASYTFRKDYYWMASNNPVNLSDSRLFGLVPHDHLIGRASRIWYSSRKERIFQPVQ